MPRLSELAIIKSGSPQARIREALLGDAPVYPYYGQPEMESDLNGIEEPTLPKEVRTYDEVTTLEAGDLVFSLASGKCTIVQPSHSGYVITQNYVKIVPSPQVVPSFLAYILNEDERIRHQLAIGQQGSATMRFSIKQLSELELSELPFIEVQELMGKTYFDQLRLAALKTRLASSEVALVKMKLKGIRQS